MSHDRRGTSLVERNLKNLHDRRAHFQMLDTPTQEARLTSSDRLYVAGLAHLD